MSTLCFCVFNKSLFLNDISTIKFSFYIYCGEEAWSVLFCSPGEAKKLFLTLLGGSGHITSSEITPGGGGHLAVIYFCFHHF